MRTKLIIFLFFTALRSEAQLHRNLSKMIEKYFYNLPYDKYYEDWLNEWRSDEHVEFDSMVNKNSKGYHYFGYIRDHQPFALNAETVKFSIGANDWKIFTAPNDTLHEGTYTLFLMFEFPAGDSSKKLTKQIYKNISRDLIRCTDIEREVTPRIRSQGREFETLFFYNRIEKVPILKLSYGEWDANQQPFIIMQLDFGVR